MARRRERGAALVLVVFGMLALLAMAGLAVDTAHVLLNKSRLQSALDAAALAAAKSLSGSTDTKSADSAASNVFTLNLAQYPELQRAGLTLTTQYSSTLIPFNAGTAPAAFVRVSITGFATQMSLSSVLGITSMNVAGSAVAGPSPPLVTACNIVPVFVCADTTVGTAPLFNFQVGQVLGLNLSAGSTTTIGPGNYGLLAIGGNGADVVAHNLAGDYANCASVNQSVPTEPGVAAGPVADGINTRFNVYKGNLSSTTYPPDPVNSAAHQTSLTQAANGDVMQGATDISAITPASSQAASLTFNYANYNTASYDTTVPPAVPKRRVLAAPLGSCTGLANGRSSVTVSGFACVFLLQSLGNGAKNNEIFAQITSGCDANGVPGGGGPTTGPFRIQLYKSTGSPDS
jgi:Putative Flp pilus-assembly TadE/G-like